MGTVSKESVTQTPLYDFAEQLLKTGFGPYDYAKSVWLGSADPEQRLEGHHPWPTREHDGQEFVYSVPIHAGFSAVRGTALFIGRDPWREMEDPRAWLVAEANLITGQERDHLVLEASVTSKDDDTEHGLWLQLAPRGFENIPRWPDRYDPNTGWQVSKAGRAHYNPPRYEQIRMQGQMTPDYYLENATMNFGLGRASYPFEDIVVLESMVRLVAQAEQAQNEQQFTQLRQRALAFEEGRRAIAWSQRLAA